MDVNWQRLGSYEDIVFEKSDDGIARVTINRPQVRNAFRPLTVTEMIDALVDAREDLDIGVVILTGAAPRDTVADWAASIAWIQGRVSPRTRGPQLIWQWVRYRQMLRLIHRQEGSGNVITVTLTDGPLLDNLGAQEFRLRPPR